MDRSTSLMIMVRTFSLFSLAIVMILAGKACKSDPKSLPILGNQEIINGDTIRHIIPDYLLTDQDSHQLRISEFDGKLYIADFFFTSCPSICPRVQKQMLRLYDKYKDDQRVLLLSHTIDQRHDSVTVLNRYAKKMGVDSEKWKFLTAQKDTIFHLADQYFVSVVDDPSAPQGFDHSGRIILVDKNRHIRGFCEGTDPESVSAFFATVDQLLTEEYK